MERDEIAAAVVEMRRELVELRRAIHREPELAFREEKTAALVVEHLTGLGLSVRTGIGGTGVVALLEGSQPGKTLLVRADMDALPLREERDVPYRSQNEGVMHACGHDGNTAVAVTAAKLLASHRHLVKGRIKFAFQPAEEVSGGALRMIEEGVLGEPRPDACLALHLWNKLPLGKVGVRIGPTFASTDEFRLVIEGRGAHGAEPHEAVDAIVVASQVVCALQTLRSREVPPLKPAVVSIGTIRGGSAFNIIAGEVEMTGTVRTFEEGLRQRLLARIDELAGKVAGAMGARHHFERRFGSPPVVNDAAMCELVRRAAAAVVGEANVIENDPSMGGEDMAYFMQAAPGCYFTVGSANAAKGLAAPHHTTAFDFDEEALPIALEVLTRSALSYLAQPS